MKQEDVIPFFSAKITPRLDQLWYQEGGQNTYCRPLSEHRLVDIARILISGIPTTTIDMGNLGCDVNSYQILIDGIKTGYNKMYPIKVAINHVGQCVITDGLHRASASLALGKVTIPAEIVYRSEPWQSLKFRLYAQNKGLRCYQKPDHPDLESWPVWRRDSQNRADTIAEYLRANHPGASCGLDLACNSGLVTLGLARHGYTMTGLDTDEQAIRTAQALAPMHTIGQGKGKATFATCKPVWEPGRKRYDFVVCLSLLNHHQVDGRSEQGQEIFRSLVKASPVVILDAPSPGDAVGGSSEYVDPAKVIEWCIASGATGSGKVLSPRSSDGLMRTLIVWERGIDNDR